MIIISHISLRHRNFVEEMRSILKKSNVPTDSKEASAKNDSAKRDEDAVLRAELERKFDELFGPLFDDDEN